jgi:HK97 family phage major capsid protein
MSKALELRQARGVIAAEMKQIVESETGDLKDAKLARFNELDAKQKELKSQIDRIEATDALDAELRTVKPTDKPQVGDVEKRVNAVSQMQTRVAQIQSSDEYRDGFRSFLKTGRTSPILEEMRSYAAMGDAAGADGVTLVPIGFQKELEKKLKAIGGVRQVARVITTATGNPLHWPTMDDTANVGSWLAEGNPVAQTNPTMDEVVLGANLASSDQVLASVQLLQDSAFDVEGFLAEAFAIRLQRLTNLAYTSGNGTGQPKGLIAGLVTAGSRSVTAVGSSTNDSVGTSINSVGSDDIDNLIAKVDPAYRANGVFEANMATYDALRKVKDKYGRSIWSAGLAENEPDTIRGYKYVYNQAMDVIGASNVSLLFGDHSKYIIRDVLGFQLVRFNELFMGSHQVGFQAYLRTDGKLLQSAAFAILTHPAS